MVESITGIEMKKSFWILIILLAIILFFANIGLRYLFEKKIDWFYSIIVTLFFVLVYFLITLFTNLKRS